MNKDRDILILDARSANNGKERSKDAVGKDRPRDNRDSRSRDRGADRNSRGGGSGGGIDRSSHRDRDSDRSSRYDNRSSFNGGGTSGGSRGQNAKFSGMAFTESELLTEIPKKKFTGRCRLFVGNLPNEVKESELKELFTPHGDISECYLSGKGFAFLRLDTRAHAESAKEALDGKTIHGRQIRVRFAVHGATIKVKELAPVVSNEMLHLTFSAFGDVERAVHIVDEKGKPTGEGIIEFERKSAAVDALAQIQERVFLLTSNSRPLKAEMLEPRDEEDGLSERMLQRTPQLMNFEHVYGQRWKELYDMEKKRREDLERELKEARHRLDADMEIAYEDYKTQLLREDLQRRQQELERLEAAKRERMQRQGPPPPFSGLLPPHREGVMDGPMGRNPPTFGGTPQNQRPGMGGGVGFFGLNNAPPNNIRPGPDTKLTDVQKILQTFKGDGLSQRPHNDFFLQNANMPPGHGHNSLPNLLNIVGPFANVLNNGGGGPPPRPPGGMPLPPDQFQPPEKRLRR